jgi:myo-inositol-1(or 4)-monophosphatase
MPYNCRMQSPTLSDLTELARGAGAILRGGFGQRHTIRHKGRIDLVTEYDKRSEDYLVGELHSRFPGHTLYAEEGGKTEGHADAVWYIDPLDGTTNYAHGFPLFAVSIAYAEAGALRLGAVYNPIYDEMYTAELGKGARFNGELVGVSEPEDLLHSLLTTGFAYDDWVINTNLEHFIHFSRLCQGVRRLGSAALDLCYIASGRLDGYWEISLQPWDSAAGGLIAREAGATVTALDGDPNFLKPPYAILAAPPALHSVMLEQLRVNGQRRE